jgi:uncharacterized protein YvpB
MFKKITASLLALICSLCLTTIDQPADAAKVYNIHFQYTSQLYPLYAPNACEAASLKMALSAKKNVKHPSLKTIINNMPRSKSPNYGFNGNPYKESPAGITWTIYPKPLTKYAKKYDPQAANISGAHKSKLIYEVEHHNPVIFAGAWRMQSGRPYHVLTLVGYKYGYFRVADPYMQRSWTHKVYWTNTRQFMKIYRLRHQRAVAIR